MRITLALCYSVLLCVALSNIRFFPMEAWNAKISFNLPSIFNISSMQFIMILILYKSFFVFEVQDAYSQFCLCKISYTQYAIMNKLFNSHCSCTNFCFVHTCFKFHLKTKCERDVANFLYKRLLFVIFV